MGTSYCYKFYWLEAIVVLISLALSYVEIDTIKVPDEALESIEEISAYEETSEKTAALR